MSEREFISLREFLLLKDPFDIKFPRSAFRTHHSPEGWVMIYDIAKASYEKYGDDPPFGSKICTLQPGHGGDWGQIRTLKGVFNRDNRCFELARINSSGEEEISIVARSQWWVEFMVIDLETFDFKARRTLAASW